MTALLASPSDRVDRRPLRELGADKKVDRAVRLGATLVGWGGLLLVTYWWDADGGITDLAHWATGLTSLGRLTGLWSADLLLVQVLLMSRLPPLEHAYGRERLARIFSTYREDSVVFRLDRGELTLDECPAEVARWWRWARWTASGPVRAMTPARRSPRHRSATYARPS